MISKNIERAISHLITSRELGLKMIKGLSHEKLITIPEGFNNSIYWNIGHLVVTQQILHYQLSGLPSNLPQSMMDNFRKGSVAKANYLSEDWETILEHYTKLPLQLKEDYENNLFKSYHEYITSFGVTLSTIEDAINFNNIHEGMHLGYILALKRAI